MKWHRGTRPWPVWLFALATIAIACLRLDETLMPLYLRLEGIEPASPALRAAQDWRIIMGFTWFTIALIPAVLVFGFRSRFARWFITATAFVPLVTILYDIADTMAYPRMIDLALLKAAIPIALAGLLFLPQNRDWFAKGSTHDAQAHT